MSSFQLNLSSLTLGAKDRLARLDAAGGALKARLLSPPAVDSTVSIFGPSSTEAAAPDLVPGAGATSTTVAGGGGSGELLLSGGVPAPFRSLS